MAFGRWLVGGIIGGLIGAIAWVAIGYFANAEVGIVAWGIGLLVGGGVRLGAATDDQDPSVGQGVLAAVLALVTILGAKYVVVEMLVDNTMGEISSIQVDRDISDEDMILTNAYDILDEREEAGRKSKWPAGKTYENAESEADFPKDVWREASQKWNSLSSKEKREAISTRKEAVAQFAELLNDGLADEMKSSAFKDSFTFFDLLWFGLALYTAFNVGVGAEDD